jgi:hypothetical protein
MKLLVPLTGKVIYKPLQNAGVLMVAVNLFPFGK